VLAPALRDARPVSLWPFDGPLRSLLVQGNLVVAETYPQNATAGSPKPRFGSKRNEGHRREFGASLLRWADARSVMLANCLTEDIRSGFPQGDDAFDAVVGLFGMLQVCLGQRALGEPDDREIREVEGWILGRAD
jgi:hypothetical protein